MRTVDASSAPRMDNPHGVNVSRLYDTEHAQVVHIHLKPGEQLKRHITPVDAVFYVLEGQGVVEVGEEKRTVTADTLIDSPKNIPHCWHNESNADLRVLVIKVPSSTDPTQLL
ncbi:MAG: cupin domain-containing protein [Planctomycetota bacterium]|nr:cupin domain-containing protein [Planctomycetota bacterium]